VEVEVDGRCMHASRGKWTVDEAKREDIGTSDERTFYSEFHACWEERSGYLLLHQPNYSITTPIPLQFSSMLFLLSTPPAIGFVL